MSGDAMKRGSPALSPVNDGSKAMVKKPRSAMVWAYRPLACSFTAPNGPDTARAASMPAAPLRLCKSAASVMS